MARTKPNDVVVHRDWSWDFPVISHTEGIYLYDKDGKRYIDGSGGSSVVVTIGHGVREVYEAMYEQAKRTSFYPAHMFSNEQALELGELIAELAPGDMKNACKVWFCCTGTDATDDAVRLARQYFIERGEPSKYLVIARWQGFHGNSISAAGYSGHTFRRRIYTPMFVDSPHIPPAYCYRCPFDDVHPSCGLKCARALEKTIRQYGPENIAAFIAEPVVGASLGAVPAPDGYFQKIREICDRYDVLLIVDEVMTAWGRVGKMFGIEHWCVTPDIIATAKGMSSGYTPLAAIIAHDWIWEPLRQHNSPFRAGHTLNANPVSCSGGKAVLNYLIEKNLVARSGEMGEYFLDRLRELLEFEIVGDVRGKGLMLGFEFVKDKDTKEPFPPELAVSRIAQEEAFERGLVIYACTGCVDGAAGDMILMAPPLIIERNEVDQIIDILKETISAVEKRVL
ncbi:MAG: aminotransferase class III-fold pyridoxal phosphate-dependent enzyme [bacterium]